MSRQPQFQPIWREFEHSVSRRFGAALAVDKKSGYADAAAVVAQAMRHMASDAEAKFPLVSYETEFCHCDGQWRPYRDVLTGTLREEEYLREVKWFFEDFCRSDAVTLAGIEEPRTAVRRFSSVNFFTLNDNIRIDVKRGDLYTEDRRSDGWTLIFSELLICPSADFDALASTLNGEADSTPNSTSRPSRTKNTSAAQRRCEERLAKYAAAEAEGIRPHIPRDVLKADAMKALGISGKAFDRAWVKVAEKYPNLSKHGVRPTNRKSNPPAT